MLVFPLKKEWYDKIKSGKKTIEYREMKPYWSRRIFNELKRELKKTLSQFKKQDRNSAAARIFRNGKRRSYAIYFSLQKGEKTKEVEA
ncbi:hypothetical protein [Treponema denticola]|uniref:hypothetical protein n=1 Tax=Treponema denticola TaxID=158 RepID=UPI0020A55317|nr:hypothetical protein [Treponema denticola]UTC82653.1 hypothetical protein HGJ18_05320 [Treponema denticola]